MKIIIMIICVALSAFFSATETSFSSSNRIKLLSLAEDGNKRAAKVLSAIEKYDSFLTTILIGNNVVNILFASLSTILFIDAFNETYGSTLSTVASTLIVLIFGEITPKSLAKQSPEKFAMAVIHMVRGFMVILKPFTLVFAAWTKLIAKIVGGKDDPSITDDELLTIVKEAENEGGLDKNESELIQNAIVFDDRQAEDILTPRVDIVAVPEDADTKEIAEAFSETGYSRIPVYSGSLDNIIGIIHQKDFYEEVIDKKRNLADILQKAVFVAPTMKISNLLRELQKEQTHIAVVVDEYGGTAGLVTMEDILEELVGEIWDEHDEVVEDVIEEAENTFLVQGTVILEDFFEIADIEDEESDSDTVSGWIMEKLGHIPEENETFEYNGLKITITETQNRRIVEVKIEKPIENSAVESE